MDRVSCVRHLQVYTYEETSCQESRHNTLTIRLRPRQPSACDPLIAALAASRRLIQVVTSGSHWHRRIRSRPEFVPQRNCPLVLGETAAAKGASHDGDSSPEADRLPRVERLTQSSPRSPCLVQFEPATLPQVHIQRKRSPTFPSRLPPLFVD